jgi:hypothetical protein
VAISADAVTIYLPKTVYRLAMLLSVKAIQSADERSALIGFYMAHLGIQFDLGSMSDQNALPSGYLAACCRIPAPSQFIVSGL